MLFIIYSIYIFYIVFIYIIASLIISCHVFLLLSPFTPPRDSCHTHPPSPHFQLCICILFNSLNPLEFSRYSSVGSSATAESAYLPGPDSDPRSQESGATHHACPPTSINIIKIILPIHFSEAPSHMVLLPNLAGGVGHNL